VRGGEQRSREQGARGVTDWYAAGVVVTCRWLAAVIVTDQDGYRFPAYAPVTRRRRCGGRGGTPVRPRLPYPASAVARADRLRRFYDRQVMFGRRCAAVRVRKSSRLR
jgi:hypothetical protein